MQNSQQKGTVKMVEKIASINQVVNGFIWGAPAMICIIGVGLLLSVRTRFIQIRKFGVAMKNTVGKIFDKTQAKDGSMSPFQAVCTALAGTVGTGNIAGVAGAIALGGPGAIFWMWCSAPWHVYEILRSHTGNPFPREELQWRVCRRSHVLHQKRTI